MTNVGSSKRINIELSPLASSNAPVPAPERLGQSEGKKCEWLTGTSAIPEMLSRLPQLNKHEKASLTQLGNAALSLKVQIENGRGIFTRLRLWAEEKFGGCFPQLRGYKAKIEGEEAQAKAELAGLGSQMEQYAQLSSLREKCMTVDRSGNGVLKSGLKLSDGDKSKLAELLSPPQKSDVDTLNGALATMRSGEAVAEPLSLTERNQAIEALLGKHERQATLEGKLSSILASIAPKQDDIHHDAVQYLPYEALTGKYAANKDQALKGLASLLRNSLTEGQAPHTPQGLREALVMSVTDKDSELMLAKLMIDLRQGVGDGTVPVFTGKGADPLAGFVTQPLRKSAASSQDDLQLWDISKADFLSMTADPVGCMSRAAESATAGGTLMEQWLFLAAGAVDENQARGVAGQFDGGARIINKAGDEWFKKHPVQLTHLARPLYNYEPSPMAAREHAGLGAELESEIHRHFSSLSNKLSRLSEGGAGTSTSVQAFATVLQNKFNTETAGFGVAGNLANFAKVAKHLNRDALLSLPHSITQKWSPDAPAAQRLSSLKDAQATEIENRKALEQANRDEHEAFASSWVLGGKVQEGEHAISELKKEWADLISTLPATELEANAVLEALSEAEDRLKNDQMQLQKAEEKQQAAQETQQRILSVLPRTSS